MKLTKGITALLLALTMAATPVSAAVPDLTTAHSLDELQLLAAPLTLEELTAEADEWRGYVQENMSKIAHLKVAAISAEGEKLDEIDAQLAELGNQRAELIAKLGIIVDSMDLKGADPAVTEAYRNYVKGALASELQGTDIRTMATTAMEWVIKKDGGVGLLFSVATVFASLFVLMIVARFIRALAKRGINRIPNLSNLLQDFLLKVVYWLTFAIGLMIVLALFGVNITPLFAVLGGASFILAFAMQETLGNLAAGLMIMINKPFDVGDLVDTNGVLGEVEAVSIVSTTVRTLDNQVVILPNSGVWGSIIRNVTVSPQRRVDMVFGIGYGDDMETASRVLHEIVAAHPKILKEPEPLIKVHELADSSVNFICRPWTLTEDYWDVYWDLTRQVKEGFDAAGVSIPFPQRDVHLYQENA